MDREDRLGSADLALLSGAKDSSLCGPENAVSSAAATAVETRECVLFCVSWMGFSSR